MYKLQTPWQLFLILLFTVLIGMPETARAAVSTQAHEATGERIRLMVKFDPTIESYSQTAITSAAVASAANTSATIAADSLLPRMGWQVIEVDAGAADQVITELQSTEGIIEVTADYPLELAWKPNDPGFIEGSQWAIEKLRADVAWEFSTGQEITVAVLDSGIDPNHPEFEGRTVPGYNFVDQNDDTTDLCGHGTHVSGIIAAETNNAIGMAGVAPQAKIMPLKVIGDNCMGSYSRLMQAIIYAVDHGVRILSITSGGAYDHAGLRDALAFAREEGVLVVVAAGNRNSDEPFYPGSFAESFTISGTDRDDNKYNNSNFGQQIDMSAPATDVYSTYYTEESGSTYAYLTGTSMATPHVAAVAALILSIDPKLPLSELENALISSAVDLGEPGWDPIFGWGRLRAWRAVAAVSPAAGNVRIGHFRVPQMDAFTGVNASVISNVDSIRLTWTQDAVAAGQTIVIYRSIVPVFEAAMDIAEVDAAAAATFDDTDVEAEQEYYYWLVLADNDVEIAITDLLSVEVSSTPEQPTPEQVTLYMPVLQR